MRWVAVALFGGAAIVGCATLNVSSHVERGINFADYVTYDWGQRDLFPVGDPRLDNNEFFRDHLEGALEQRLAVKGYERVKDGEPDVLIHYHATVSQRLDVRAADQAYVSCYGEDCAAYFSDFEQGTIVVDFVDRRTNKLIWRGWAQDTMTGVIDNQDRLERQVDEGVMKMMQLLPRGGAALR